MTGLSSDILLDRRRLKRRLWSWQALAIVALLALGLVAVDRLGVSDRGGHIARLTVEGVIVDDLERSRALQRIADADEVRALIVRIDSPGGTVVGGESLYRDLREVAKEKPVVAVMRQLGTSAAYMAALGSDRIFAGEGTITGSIGVIVQTTEVTDLLDSLGITTEAIKSSALKAQPNPLEPLSPRAREAIQGLVNDIYEMFVGLVAERRAMTIEQARDLADGRVFTGRQAIGLGLIDELGGEMQARQWLIDERSLDASLRIRSVEVESEGLFSRTVLSRVGKTIFPERLRVDGLVALWHP